MPRDDSLGLAGMPQKNKLIVETIRSAGYIAVMLNEEDFYNAVIWATNAVDRFEMDYRQKLNDKIVIPISELKGIDKPMLVNAYLLLIIYYHRRGNVDLVSSLKLRFLNNVAKFQYLPPDHVVIMANWDTYMADVKRRLGVGDHSAPDMTNVAGTRDIFDYYQGVIKKEKEQYRREMSKEAGLGEL